MYLTQYPNNYTLVLGVVLLFMEATTHFVSARWLFFEHGISGSSILQAVNSAGLFLSFLFCRIVFQTYTYIFSGVGYFYSIEFASDSEATVGFKIMLWFMTASILVNYGLNIHWFHLILK